MRTVLSFLLVSALAAAAILFGAATPSLFGPIAAALFLGALVALGAALAGRSGLGRDPALTGAALLLLATLASLSWSISAHATLGRAVLVLGAAAAYGLAAHATGSPLAARRVAAALLVVATATAVYGLAMTLSGREMVLWLPKAAYRDSLTGTFINRNHFAAFLALNLYPLLGWLAGGSRRVRLALVPVAALLLLSLGLTLSRGGLLATAAALPVFVLLLPPASRRLAWPSLAALALAGALLGLTNADRLRGRIDGSLDADGEPSAAARLSIWRSTLRAAADRPILGHGAGTFASFYPRYREPGIARKVTYAHQEYLELAAEQGLLGLAAAALAFALLCLALARARATAAAGDRPLVAGALAGALAVALHANVDFPLKIPAVALWTAAWLGLAVALGERPPALPARARVPLAALAALVLVVGGGRALVAGLGDQALRRGEGLFAGRLWDRAATSFERATTLDPLNPAAWDGRGRVELNRAKFRGRDEGPSRTDRLQAALANFARADALDPGNGDYNLERGFTFNLLGQRQAAAAEYLQAVADDPQNGNTLQLAGLHFLHRGDRARGIDLIGRAIRAWPRLFGGKLHELHPLVGDVGALLALVPHDQPFLAYQYAVFLAQRGEQAGARRAFAQATADGGWRPDWLVPFAGLVAQHGSPAEALAVYAEVPDAARTAATELEVAKLLLASGRRDDAVRRLDQASQAFPAGADLVRFLVLVGGGADSVRAAIARLEDVGRDPAGAAVARGHLALGRRDPDGAVGEFANARALDPRNPHARDGLVRTLGLLAGAAGERGDCALADQLERDGGLEAAGR